MRRGAPSLPGVDVKSSQTGVAWDSQPKNPNRGNLRDDEMKKVACRVEGFE